MMNNSRIRLSVVVLLAALSISGCSGGATMEARTTTVGQELVDLDKAYKEGIISEKEYKKQKEDILDRN